MTVSDPPAGPLTILITGASAGIGRVTCERLAGKKHRFVLAARSVDKLNQLQSQLTSQGADSLSVPTDVRDPDALESLVRAAVDRFGRIDVLINNAGVECFARFDDIPIEQMLQTIETNLTGAILLTRHVVPVMRKQGFGRIINISSTAGKHGPAYGAVYAATKAGLIGFTQSLRGELMTAGIYATAICPGFTIDGGIYDEIIRTTGRKTSRLAGGTTADAVAAAIEKAIHTAPPEVLVNFPPMRPVFVFREMFPRFTEKLIIASMRKFLNRVASRGK